jgi:hypothetical protein
MPQHYLARGFSVNGIGVVEQARLKHSGDVH